MNFLSKRSEFRDLVIAYKQTFGTDQGRRVLLDLMDMGNILNSHGGDLIKEGKRALVCEILKRVHLNIKQLDELLTESEDKTA